MTDSGTWEDEARNWVAWARTAGHDVFPFFAPVFFEEILPSSSRLTLEVGCGEGRVVREMAARGHRVVGLDGSATLVGLARDADAQSAYIVGDGTRLPFGDGTFGTLVAYNSLQTMVALDDMERSVREAGRVVLPGGHLCLCVAHPMTDIVRNPTGGEFVLSGSYFENEHVEDTVTSRGLSMTFRGWTYTVEDYARAIEGAGFVIERVREPRPSAEDVAARASLERWRRVPLFLMVRAVRRGG